MHADRRPHGRKCASPPLASILLFLSPPSFLTVAHSLLSSLLPFFPLLPQFLFEWDTLLLDMWGLTQNEYGVLSTYVPRFEEMGLNTNERWEVCTCRWAEEMQEGRDVSIT